MNEPAMTGSASEVGADTVPTTQDPPTVSAAQAAGEGGAEGAEHNGSAPGAHLMREAISMIKQHPLGAMATVAAATALIEVELAVGILAGIGATALLANESGSETRQKVLEQGRRALSRARTAMTKPKEPQVAPPV